MNYSVLLPVIVQIHIQVLLVENHEENIKKPVDADLNLKKREEYAHFATTTSRAKACITFG